MKKQKPKFYVLHKDFNNGNVEPYEVLDAVFSEILTEKGSIRKKYFTIFNEKHNLIPVKTKEQCAKFVKNTLMYYFWGKCECEFVVIDWPYRDTIDQSRPVKVDMFEQLKPNLPLIVDLVWDYVEPKITKLYKNE